MSSDLTLGANYSTTELKRRITIFLAQKGVSSAKLLSIEVEDGTVTFRGTVVSFYERQICLSCNHIPGVRKVVDDLKVELRPEVAEL